MILSLILELAKVPLLQLWLWQMIWLVPWIENSAVLPYFIQMTMNCCWNDFVAWAQCVNAEDHKSEFLEKTKGVPQGSILGQILFSIFINDLGKDIQAKTHLYADDIIYTHSPYSTGSAEAPLGLKLVLYAQKTKFIVFLIPVAWWSLKGCPNISIWLYG